MGGELRPAILAAIEHAAGRSFEWGRDDCGLWVANIVLHATGLDLADGLRGRYRTALGAARTLRRFGGSDYRAALETAATRHGLQSVTPSEAITGDLGVLDLDSPFRSALAIHIDGWWASRGDPGVVFARSSSVLAWRLPCLR